MAELRCLICGKTFDSAQSEAMPFCSPRCKQVDLGRWFDEKYGMPYEADEEETEAFARDGSTTQDDGT
ncbi:MAG: DNA gyrase inhibitor YacG [Pirellulales bacterium]|nr:DNA gyrase inhibitor YacG [Pirellulales bacterium]